MGNATFTTVGALIVALAGTGLLEQRQRPSPGGFQVALSADGFQYADEHGNINRRDSVRDTFQSLGAVWGNSWDGVSYLILKAGRVSSGSDESVIARSKRPRERR